MGLKVLLGHEIISKSTLGGNSASTTSRRRGEEEVYVRKSESSNGDSGRTDEDEVHDITTLLVNVEVSICCLDGGGDAGSSHGGGSESEGGSCGEESGGEGEELHLDVCLRKLVEQFSTGCFLARIAEGCFFLVERTQPPHTSLKNRFGTDGPTNRIC